MELSKRLAAIAKLVKPGQRVADIGTDHGYLPIWLVKNGVAPSAIAMDVNAGPLERAKAHVEAFNLEERILLRKSDGLEQLLPGEADTAVIAGMGGLLMIRILENGDKTAKSLHRMILSPQSEIAQVRKYLLEHEYSVLQETMLCEEGKYYLIMEVAPGIKEEEVWCMAEIAYGKHLLRSKDSVVLEYLEKEQHTMKTIWNKLKEAATDKATERLLAVEEELSLLEEAMELFHKEERE